jgi:hypothetical protein
LPCPVALPRHHQKCTPMCTPTKTGAAGAQVACGRRFGDVEGLSWGEVAWGEGERCGADAVLGGARISPDVWLRGISGEGDGRSGSRQTRCSQTPLVRLVPYGSEVGVVATLSAGLRGLKRVLPNCNARGRGQRWSGECPPQPPHLQRAATLVTISMTSMASRAARIRRHEPGGLGSGPRALGVGVTVHRSFPRDGTPSS